MWIRFSARRKPILSTYLYICVRVYKHGKTIKYEVGRILVQDNEKIHNKETTKLLKIISSKHDLLNSRNVILANKNNTLSSARIVTVFLMGTYMTATLVLHVWKSWTWNTYPFQSIFLLSKHQLKGSRNVWERR